VSRRVERRRCPRCGELVYQAADVSGQSFCPNCRQLFSTSSSAGVLVWGLWTLAVVVLGLWCTL